MNIYQKLKKILSIIVISIMMFSPLTSALAEENQTTQPVNPVPVETTAPQPTRGVDQNQLGPQQPVENTPAPTIPPETNTPPLDVTKPETAVEQPTNPEDSEGEIPDEYISNENENTETGKNSENTDEKDKDTSTNIGTDNDATVTNEIRGIIGTAGNVAMGQRGNIAIETGDAEAAINIINLINTIFAGLGSNVQFVYKNVDGNLNENYIIDATGNVTNPDGTAAVINDNTGKNSENSATSNSDNQRGIETSNLSKLINNINLGANTGDNAINNKVGDNLIKTGDVNLSLNLLNFLNSTFVVGEFGVVGILNIFGDWTGNLLLPQTLFGDATTSPTTTVTNSNTGQNSENSAVSGTTNTNSTTSNNKATINNNVSFSGSTGGNQIDSKVGDSSITTGSINFLLGAKNFANITVIGDVIYLAFVNVLGKWTGTDLISKIFGFNSPVASNDNQANAPNVNNNNTGVNSENNVNSSDNNKTQNSVNNNGSVTNNIDLIANTGGNKISGERGDSTIQTGNINVITNIINFINANFSGKRLVMLFVNVFGNWNGNIDFLKKDAPKPVIALTDETTETQIPLAEVKVDQVKSAKVLNVNTLSDKTVPVENEKNNNEQHEKPQVLAASTNGQEDTQDGVLYESVQDKSPIDYIFSNLNWIIFGCLFTYLASVAIYLKAVKKIKI